MKDWERQNWLLHQHGNIKFVSPLPRYRKQPVVQVFEKRRHYFGDIAVTVGIVCVILAAAMLIK